MPSTAHEKPRSSTRGWSLKITDTDLSLDTFMPDSDNAGYDMRDVISKVFDDGAFLEIAELFAPNLLTGFARVDGNSVGIVANQPNVVARHAGHRCIGEGDPFVHICNAFNIPLIFLVDTPGILPGAVEEAKGTIRRSGKVSVRLHRGHGAEGHRRAQGLRRCLRGDGLQTAWC